MPRPNDAAALPNEVDAVIIGAGFAGLAMGRRLKRSGVDDFLILERGDGVGGVWRANRYPGAACDVPSHLYSFSFFLNPDWSRKFSPQAEILSYLERAAAEFGLTDHVRPRCSVTALSFDEPAGRWTVTLADGRTLTARAVVSAVGQLSEPFTPPIDGLSEFAGPVVHSADWDASFEPSGKRVAVIGNAASAIQLLPSTAEAAERLIVFQRTPNWVIPKPDRAFTGLEKWLFRHVPGWNRLYRLGSYLIHETRYPAFLSGSLASRFTHWRLKSRLNAAVKDPALRARLTPDYAPGCKRILLSNDYFQTLQREDVDLVSDGVARVEPDALITRSGARIEADAIILATGFQTTEFLPTLEVTGREGRSLREVWGDSPRAYRGVAMHGFPNLFLLYGPNTNLGHNSIVFMLEQEVEYAGEKVEQILREDLRTLEVTEPAETRFNEALQARLAKTVWAEDCPSWYKTADGVIVNNWSGLATAFAASLKAQDELDWAAAR